MVRTIGSLEAMVFFNGKDGPIIPLEARVKYMEAAYLLLNYSRQPEPCLRASKGGLMSRSKPRTVERGDKICWESEVMSET